MPDCRGCGRFRGPLYRLIPSLFGPLAPSAESEDAALTNNAFHCCMQAQQGAFGHLHFRFCNRFGLSRGPGTATQAAVPVSKNRTKRRYATRNPIQADASATPPHASAKRQIHTPVPSPACGSLILRRLGGAIISLEPPGRKQQELI
jgi:hypothetical protein